jgi:uncharacterized protein YyaL (SSP411 family)
VQVVPTSSRLSRSLQQTEAALSHGKRGHDNYLDDYAFLNQGLLELHEASFDVRLLSWRSSFSRCRIACFGSEAGRECMANDQVCVQTQSVSSSCRAYSATAAICQRIVIDQSVSRRLRVESRL